MSCRSLVPIILCTQLGLAGAASADPVVVELFTSQGCSSCPPADAVLGELAQREDVIALSLHVDYWDWIGWPDGFAHAAFTARQRAYAEVAHSNVIYTPQFIVGGVDQIEGAAPMELAEAIGEHHEAAADVLRMAMTSRGREAIAMPVEGGGRIVLVTYLPKAVVKVEAGENAGRVIDYHNVVEAWDVLADWDGEEAAFVLPDPPAGRRQAVIVQAWTDGRPGPVLGAVHAD